MIKLKIMPNFSTRRKPRHPRRCQPLHLVARPQLPVAVVAPAVDAAAAQQGTRVIVSRGEGHDSWVRRRRVGMMIIRMNAWEASRMS